MKEVLNTMVQAMGAQAVAMGGLADQITALERMLARQFPDLADELKAQIVVDHEQCRKDVYELQVSLAKLREAIAQLPEAEAKVARKRKPSKPATQAAA